MDIIYPDRSIFDGMVMSPFLGCLLTHGHVVHFQLSPREFAFFTVFVLTRPMANTTRYGSDPARFPVSR